MRIGVTGVSGFIGSRLAERAVEAAHEVVGFSRSPGGGHPHCVESRRFRPGEPADVSGLDGVVHLAGESVLGLWTAGKRRAIRESRILGTRSVVDGIAADGRGIPLVAASATGYYGDTGDEVVDESAPPGKGFLAEVSREWEASSLRAAESGARVVLLRIGFVIGPSGGAVRLLRPVFRLGLGGRLGSGRQWMSLVHVDDVAGLALRALDDGDLQGPLNAVMPEPIRNRDFTDLVARLVHRPAVCHAPAFVLRMLSGELSTLFLHSHRVVPRVAEGRVYGFRHADPEGGLRDALAVPPRNAD